MPSKPVTPKPDMKQWYAATLIVRLRPEDHPGPYTCYGQIHLIHARSAEKAYKKAYKLGKAQDTCFLNNDGKMVFREFIGLQDLNLVGPQLDDSILVKSREFIHSMPQILVHTQDELSAFGKSPNSGWQIVAEVTAATEEDRSSTPRD